MTAPDAYDDSGLPDEEQLVLGELLNHVLDKGVVLTGDITISVADIDLVRVGLSVFISAVETLEQRAGGRDDARGDDGTPPVLPAGRGE